MQSHDTTIYHILNQGPLAKAKKVEPKRSFPLPLALPKYRQTVCPLLALTFPFPWVAVGARGASDKAAAVAAYGGGKAAAALGYQ